MKVRPSAPHIPAFEATARRLEAGGSSPAPAQTGKLANTTTKSKSKASAAPSRAAAVPLPTPAPKSKPSVKSAGADEEWETF